MRLTKTTSWSLATAVLCLALAVASWFLLVGPERAAATQLRTQTAATQSSNVQLEARIAQLELDFAQRPARDAELAAIRQALPDEPALARLTREVSAAGEDTGVTVDSIVTGGASAFVDLTAVVGTPAAPADAPSPEASAPAETEDGAPAPPVAPGAITAVPGAPAGTGLASVPVTITTTGDFGASVRFLEQVQAEIQRALLVDAVTMTAVPAVEAAEGVEAVPEGIVGTTITARVFVFVDALSVQPPPVTP